MRLCKVKISIGEVKRGTVRSCSALGLSCTVPVELREVMVLFSRGWCSYDAVMCCRL